MKFWLCLGLSLSTLSACQGQPASAPSSVETPNPTPEANPSAPTASPTPAASPEAKPAAPAEPAFSEEPEANKYPDHVLEGYPGFTPSLPLVRFPATPVVGNLEGAPGDSPAMGASEPLLRIFVFSDFQCSVCRRVVEPLKKLVRAYPDDIQVVFKHLPLPNHRTAEPAARASIAAFRQGRFWDYHDRLFERQRGLNEADLILHAQNLGFDMKAFTEAYGTESAKAQVAYEAALARTLGLTNTPTFFLNGESGAGWASYSALEFGAKDQLKKAQTLLEQGVPRSEVVKRLTQESHPMLSTLIYGG